MLDRGCTVRRCIHRIARAFQTPAQEIGDAFFVLDDQDSHADFSLAQVKTLDAESLTRSP